MSLVGPRPPYLSQNPELNGQQRKRLYVKPGLTGPAQISGRDRIAKEEELKLDVEYVKTPILWGHIEIVLATMTGVFGRKDIYEENYSHCEYKREMNRKLISRLEISTTESRNTAKTFLTLCYSASLGTCFDFRFLVERCDTSHK